VSHMVWLQHRNTAPTPAEFAGYLHQRGWTPQDKSDRWITFARPGSTESIVVAVPQMAHATDYPRAARVLIEDLGRVEGRPPTTIVRDVLAVATDIVRIAIDGPNTRDGRIPVEAGRRVYEATRDLLLAAACSVGDPRPAFPKNKTFAAKDMLQRARLGRTEVGSFVLTIECDVPQRMQPDLFDDDGSGEPMERRTCLRLAEAMASAGDAAREAAGTASASPFQERVVHGVSANLCESIAEILDATDADAMRTSFSFASGRPVRRAPTPVYFSRDTMGQLREAAQHLRAGASYVAFEAQGPVVKLESKDPDSGGTVVLHTEIDQAWRLVTLRLDSNDYRAAIQAHDNGGHVRCIGELSRDGRSWHLTNPRGFKAVESP
jgi:hypothetical protein